MRNSYINPVQCYTCGKTVEPFINDKWGAILVAGYDEKDGPVWRKEIDTFKDVITSKVVPAMCISSDNVIVIGSGAGQKHTFKSQIDDAFARLMVKNIRTLLFVYSGHKDDSFQVGRDENYSLKSLNEKLNEWNSKDSAFEKVIAFLDCCYSEKLDLKNTLKLIQFNATSPNDTASANEKDGSPFLKYIRQALTGLANGDRCTYKNGMCECLKLLSEDVITLEDLSKYLNAHSTTEYCPHMNTSNIKLQDTILAYNYQYEVMFEFKLNFPGMIEHSPSIYIRPREFNNFGQLKLKLATEVMKSVNVLDPDKDINVSKFATTLSIEINTGPRAKHIQEIDSVEKLVSAWNSKRLLRCTLRPLQNMGLGKPVGRCLKNVPDIRVVHKAVLQKCKITEYPLTKSDLLKYADLLIKTEKNATGHLKEYSEFLDMLSYLQKEQEGDVRFDISFFDLPNSYTVASMSIVQTTGVTESMQE
ncbi:uncharacterized protein LOC127855788 [Dreissena polymorpha]|nr:uncharacterized protein LOC127855788 [Dreissena polymorpha]